jgi:hypothetical protein
MKARFKALTAVLPVAIWAGPFGAGRSLADQTSVAPTAHTRPAPAKAATSPLVARPAPNGPSKASAPVIPVSTTTAAAPAALVPPKPVEISRVVAADRDMRLDFLYSINPDCTSIGYATVRIVEQPKHGAITIEDSTGFTSFPADNLRAECNKRRSDGVAIIYKPEPGYTGPDSADFDAIFPTGNLSKRHYTIEVR